MTTTVAQLLIRIEQLEQELVSVRQEVETLRSNYADGAGGTSRQTVSASAGKE